MVLKAVMKKARQLTSQKAVKNVLLTLFFMLIADVLVAVLGASYLSENIGTFLGKSRTVILSDLLFLEGALILAIGTLVAVARAVLETKLPPRPSTGTTANSEQTREKRINPETLMIIIGAILLGLSVTVGTLFP